VNHYTVSSAAALSLLVGFPAHAESTDKAAETPSAPTSALMEEVLVTARKRATSEAAMDAPLAISAFTAKQFKAVFADNLDDLGRLAPSVGLKPTSQVGGQNYTIRGMGVSGTTPSDEPAVGIIQDGIYWGVNYGAALDTFDIESVEILRGPQGTLFGRNVTGGAVLVRTARPNPNGDLGFAVENVIGDYGRHDVSARLQGPLIEHKLAAKIAVLDHNLDGYFRNLETGRPFGASHSRVVRGTLVATPVEHFDATLILERYRQDGDSVAAVGVEVPGNLPYRDGFRQPGNLWDIRLDNPGTSTMEVNSGVLELNAEVLQGVVTSIAGTRDVGIANTTDYDGSQFSYFNQSIGFKQKQISEELRYASKFSGRTNFTAGVYYFKQDYTHTEGRDLNKHRTVTLTRAHLDQKSYAAFSEVDIQLGEKWTATLGGRYTRETKQAKSVPFTPAATICADGSIYGYDNCNFRYGATGEHTWSDFSPKAVIRYKLVRDQLLYASVTRGFRSGGYSLRGNPIFEPFDAEQVTASEVGYKGDLLSRRLRLNAAVYSNKYKDLQRTVLGVDPVFGVVQSTFNVADATIQGLELDLVAQATDHLVLTAGYGYTNATYDSTVPGFDARNDFVRVPKNTFNASAVYDLALNGIGDLSFRASTMYTGSQFFNDANTVSESGYTLVDASINYTSTDRHWTAALFGKNLGNEKYSYWGSTLGALGANRFVGAPHTFGLRVGYEY
jgi:iron complex outermembrane receptor protein